MTGDDHCLACGHARAVHSPRGTCVSAGCGCDLFVEGPEVLRAPVLEDEEQHLAAVVAAQTRLEPDGHISVTLVSTDGHPLGRLWLDRPTAQALAESLASAVLEAAAKHN